MFTVTATLTLAAGLCAATAVFSLVNTVLLRPLPYPEPDRLVSLSHTLVVGGTVRVDQTDASLLFYGRHQRTFTHLGGYQAASAGLGPIGSTDAERVPAGRATAGLFPALRVSPLRGRVFTEADDRPGAPPVALIGERLWARKWGRDPSILNRQVAIDGEAHEIVGIMPSSLHFPASETEVWVPMRLNPAKTESATFDYQGLARLRNGVSIESAAADLQALLPRIPEEFPGRLTRASVEQTHMRASVRPLAGVVVGDIDRVLWILLAAAALVLAIACANCANLLLVRAESRREIAVVKRALGATLNALLVESLAEGFLIATVAGALALGGTMGVIQVVRSLGTVIDIPRTAELNIDAVVIAVAGLCTMCTALAVSAAPALRLVQHARSSIFAASGRSTVDRGRHRVRQVLVIGQVALALMLLVGSGLMMRSVWRLRAVRLGFDPAHAISFRVAMPPAVYPGADESVRFVARAEAAIASVSGVRAAGAVSKLPLDDQGRTDTAAFVEDRPIAPGSLPGIHPLSYITPGYFQAAGIPFIAGRTFRPLDPPRVDHEAIVSRAFARRYWGDADALGRRVRIFSAGPWYTIVGVVGAIKDTALDRADDETIYCPLLPARADPRWTPRDVAMVVRVDRDPRATLAAVRDAIRRLDPSLALYRIRPMTDIVAHASARRTFTLVLVGAASVIALLLGTVGLYGVISYVVALRTREMGIRIALGAEPRAISRMVSMQGTTLAILGITIGLAGAVALTRFLAALLFEVSPTDPFILIGAAALLLAVAAAASWLPARRAAAVDPAAAFRME